MKRKKFVGILTGIVVGIILVFSFAGCSQQSGSENDQDTLVRQYMSNVNQTIDDLSSELDDFNDAVADADVVKMRTEADSAFKELDQLSSFEAPEGLEDVKDSYVSGCEHLKDALNGYIDLYTDISSATDEYPFDYSTYDKRLSEIQEYYDNGVAELKAADEKAVESE